MMWEQFGRPDTRFLLSSYQTCLGEIPTEIGNCPGLWFLTLYNNQFIDKLELASMDLRGRLPSSIGQLVGRLTSLLLQENRIAGSIPPTLVNLTQLTVLNLTYNFLSGTIPAKISQLLYLEQLFLSHNFFTGSIPATMGQLQHLGLLDLSNNRLSGGIPKSLGDLGAISPIFANLTYLEVLKLSSNLLNGTFPAAIGQCPDLSWLDLSNNRLSGQYEFR
ncbi:unnamed protein product [Camellia sinensis]